MDRRYTSRNEIGQGVLGLKPQDGEWAVYPRHNMSEFVVLGEAIDRLAAYEDMGLSPEEITAMKAEYSDTFQAHLQQLCDIKDKRISELENQNAQRHNLVAIMDTNSAAALMLRSWLKGDTTGTVENYRNERKERE